MSNETTQQDAPQDRPSLPQGIQKLAESAVQTQDPTGFFALGLAACMVQREARRFRTLREP